MKSMDCTSTNHAVDCACLRSIGSTCSMAYIYICILISNGTTTLCLILQEFSVCTTILHENHKEDPAHYDLALLVMSKDSKHTPITISTEGLNHTMEGRVVGWGAKNEKAYYSELRSLNREITKDGECGNRTTIEVVPPFQSMVTYLVVISHCFLSLNKWINNVIPKS